MRDTKLIPLFALAVALMACSLLATPMPVTAGDGVPELDGGPRLLRVSPSEGGPLGRDVVVALSFSKPMDKDSLKEAISFVPEVDFDISGEAECLVVPVNLLDGGREYAVRMEPGRAKDLEGRPCADKFELRFWTRDDAMVIEIPALDYSGFITEGDDPQGVADIIGFGVGHYPGTGRPGAGNLVLMAHASGRIPFPFNRMTELAEDDEIRVRYGGRSYTYLWSEGLVVPEDAMWITHPQPYSLLSFFICCAADGRPSLTFHPPYRYVVRAPLHSAEPLWVRHGVE
jgi:hypothetical protein